MSLRLRAALLIAAFALPLARPGVAAAQISFEGLDLSEDEGTPAPKKKDKPKGPAKKVPPKKSPAVDPVDTPPAKLPTLDKPPTPEKKPDKPKAAPTMSFDGFDVTGKTSDRQKLEAAKGLFTQEDYEAAAVSFGEILKDGAAADQHDEARYLLAKALFRLGMYHSSLAVFREILAKGESGKYFKTSIEWLFFVSRKIEDQSVVLDEIAKYSNVEFPEKYREEFKYLLAKYNFVRAVALVDAASGMDDEDKAPLMADGNKALAETQKLLAQLPKASKFYAKAKYLEGLSYYVQGKFEPSLESFKEVVRVLNPRGEGLKDPRLREQSFMQLARIHYEFKQNRYAVFYYDKVARGSDQWLQALYEASWAHFRVGQYEKALGNMITLHSPFFQDEYFPEALILKAVIYYENCRYTEANRIVEEFNKTYLPVYQQLEALLKQDFGAPEDYYAVLDEIQKKSLGIKEAGKDAALRRILKLALSDKELRHLNDGILELDREMDGIAGRKDSFKFSETAKELVEGMKGQRIELQKKAGFYAKRKLEREQKGLADLNYRALAIKAEIGTREKDVLEASLQSGSKVAVVKDYKYSTAVDDEHVYWPYEGEFWRDELGTYQYTLTKGCKEK